MHGRCHRGRMIRAPFGVESHNALVLQTVSVERLHNHPAYKAAAAAVAVGALQ